MVSLQSMSCDDDESDLKIVSLFQSTTAHKYQPNCIYFLLWVCEGLSGTYRATHVSQGLLRSLHSVLLHADGKSSHNVAAELHRDTTALQQMTGNHSARKYGTDATKPAEVCCLPKWIFNGWEKLQKHQSKVWWGKYMTVFSLKLQGKKWLVSLWCFSMFLVSHHDQVHQRYCVEADAP